MQPIALLVFLLPLGACAPGAAREVRIEGLPERVVVIGPGTEANLWALGLGAQVVGVSDFCTVPAAATVRRVGGLANPNLERIASLEPDLVLTQGTLPLLKEWCQAAGVPLRSFGTDSVLGWREEVLWLGNVFGKMAEADAILREAFVQFDELEAASAGRTPLRVLLLVSRRPDEASGLMAAGPGTFLSDLLELAGGVNVLADARQAYVDVNEESLIRLDPQAILEFWPEGAPAADPISLWRRSYPHLAAVREGRVGAIVSPDSLIPGPAMPATAREMSIWLAPHTPNPAPSCD